MSLTIAPGINKQTFTATLLPKKGDREDFLLRVQGPDPSIDFQVPLTVSGTALAIWGNPNPADSAESLGSAIFSKIGTASLPPKEGFWFDSYNSAETLKQTVDKIYNSDVKTFIKNSSEALYVKNLGSDANQKIQELDESFSQKFNKPFFKSLEDLSEESQRVGDLNTPAKDNANYLYRISILSAIIDHIAVRISPEDEHECDVCGQRHKQSEGTIQGLKKWLSVKINPQKAELLIKTFQMIRWLRNQYPIHDHYVTANNIRTVKKHLEEANSYFDIKPNEYEENAFKVTKKVTEALDEIRQAIEKVEK